MKRFFLGVVLFLGVLVVAAPVAQARDRATEQSYAKFTQYKSVAAFAKAEGKRPVRFAQLSGGLMFPGPGGPAAAAPTYQGPGDIVSGAIMWGSFARAYNAAYANGTNPLADLVDSAAPTVTICTLRVKTNGFVDLTGAYCTGSVTPATKCAAATGGVCNISKLYDQTGTGNHLTVTVAAQQPTLTFSALSSLPGGSSVSASGTAMLTGTITQAQPLSWMAVSARTGAFTTAASVIAAGATTNGISYNTTANTVFANSGTFLNGPSQTDGAFHALEVVSNSTSSAVVVDGTAVTGNSGTNGISAVAVRVYKGAASITGTIMEVGIWPSAFNATQYGNLNTNAHGASSGYNF